MRCSELRSSGCNKRSEPAEHQQTKHLEAYGYPHVRDRRSRLRGYDHYLFISIFGDFGGLSLRCGHLGPRFTCLLDLIIHVFEHSADPGKHHDNHGNPDEKDQQPDHRTDQVECFRSTIR